ncbi:hypothetical protein F3Y22_tig00000973pilonHSYRG00018 [Hibiscus syriacus]|uniref:ubiquitinyl hydrolase 1 n=1 Tax=Hibiscus syriacus TaxID=106335 RepID=A0A6A3D1Y5_HIBSY|nr:hypothetical protein F3Y22_tig00000973pilonHSYRG00018 [Hibiscus syriacus]
MKTGHQVFDLDDGLLMGIVVNVPVKRYAGLWKSRHWNAVKKIDGVLYNLDSDLQAPQCFKDCGEVGEFLDFIISHDGQVLLVKNENRQ